MRKAVLTATGVVVAAALLRRRRGTPDRVDLYFEDGSMVSFAAGSGQADRLVRLARDVLVAARP